MAVARWTSVVSAIKHAQWYDYGFAAGSRKAPFPAAATTIVPKCQSASSSVRTFVTTAFLQKTHNKKNHLEDSATVVFTNRKKERTEMTFGELKAMAAEAKGDRVLVRVHFPGEKADELPVFNLVTVNELEAAVRTNRHKHTGVTLFPVATDGEDHDEEGDKNNSHPHRFKEKHIAVKVGISSGDLQTAISKAKKFLQKGMFVRVTINAIGKHAEAKEIEETFKSELKAVQDAAHENFVTFHIH